MDAGQRERMADDAAKVRKTPCLALGSLLARHGVAHVDVMVLDVEGSELEALRGLDLAKVSVDNFVIEMRHEATDGTAPLYRGE